MTSSIYIHCLHLSLFKRFQIACSLCTDTTRRYGDVYAVQLANQVPNRPRTTLPYCFRFGSFDLNGARITRPPPLLRNGNGGSKCWDTYINNLSGGYSFCPLAFTPNNLLRAFPDTLSALSL